MYKIRFHLGSGKHFKQWQVTNTATGEKVYIDPQKFSLEMEGVTVCNRRSTAVRINEGGNKAVCAWIETAQPPRFTPPNPQIESGNQLRFNPRHCPDWVLDGLVFNSGTKVGKLHSYQSRLYVFAR